MVCFSKKNNELRIGKEITERHGASPMPLTLSGKALAAGEDMVISPAETRG
jgi:hypothetical protein